MTTIHAKPFIESDWATPEDALRLSARIKELLDEGDSVLVDFTGVEQFVPSFLSVAIGSLYQFFPASDLDKRLHCTGLDPLEQKSLSGIRRKASRHSAVSLEGFARARQRREEEGGWEE